MRRAVVVAAAVTALTAVAGCTPEEIGLFVERVHNAEAVGAPCPVAAAARQLAGLPDHFDVVAWRESRCAEGAVSPAGALGVWQVMPSWLGALCRAGIACTESELLDVWVNARAAALVFAVQGPGAWSQTW